MVAPAPEEDAGEEKLLPNPVKIVIVVSPMRQNKITCWSHLEMLKWPSGWSMPLKHSQVNALGVIKWDISSAIRNVKCTTLSF